MFLAASIEMRTQLEAQSARVLKLQMFAADECVRAAAFDVDRCSQKCEDSGADAFRRC